MGVIIVGDRLDGGAGKWLPNMCRKADIDWASTQVVSIGGVPTEIAKADKIFACGEEALQALTGRRGITQWRGSPLPLRSMLDRPRVIPIIHPEDLMKQPKLLSVTVQDMRKRLQVPPENYNLSPSFEDVVAFQATTFAFDFEWGPDEQISHCGLSDRFYQALVIPFVEPYISELRRIFENATCLIGHNIVGADLVHLEKLGWTLRPDVRIEDTMLKQHLCQPDYKHALDFVASVWTNKVFWKGKWKEEMDEQSEGEEAIGQQWRTWDQPNALPRELGGYGGCASASEAFALYNGRDTDGEFQINTPLDSFISTWDLRHTYQHVSLPAAYICREIGERGLKLDISRLGAIRTQIDTEITELEAKLPDELRPYWKTVGCNVPAPPGTYRPKSKVCKGSKKTPHAPTQFTFDSPGCAQCSICQKSIESGRMVEAKILKGTKQVLVTPYNSADAVQAYALSVPLPEIFDSHTGRRTTGKKARAQWIKSAPEFLILGLLKKQITLRNNFAKTSLLKQVRMYFNLKVTGTAEGRLASTGQRRGIDLNIQNQPEDFRVIYVPDSDGYGFLNIDISQGENWLTAWIAQDWARWERLQDPNYDEHSELASAIFNRPVNKALAKLDKSVEALRQVGKKINHGRNYGMGVKKQLEELAVAGFDHYTQADVKEFIQIWKRMNARTAVWQNEVIETAQRQGWLRNVFGRVRWFSSFSIATEALAFLPASTLADMVLRMMIAHYPERFMDSIEANQMEVYAPMMPNWELRIQVHDSLVPHGPWDTHLEQAERSARIMTQKWKALDDFAFKVDIKGSPISWGDCKPITLPSLRMAA